MTLGPPLTVEGIRRHLQPTRAERHLYLLGEVDSTNARLRTLARLGAADGTVLIAEGQWDGRGRRRQPWFSPMGVNLYSSVLLRPSLTSSDVGVFSLISSLALTDVLKTLGVRAGIKWPNDVVVEDKKLAGTLVESGMRGAVVDHVILGVGVNLNVDTDTLAAALGEAGELATSLSAVLGHAVDRNLFAANWLNRIDAWERTWERGGASEIRRAWAERDVLIGRPVNVRGVGYAFEARAMGIDTTGALVVEDTQGRRRSLVNEEVRLRSEKGVDSCWSAS